MGGGQSQIEQPKIVRMPNPDDPSILAARDRAISLINARGGRSSTLLSNMTKTLNGSGGLLGR